MGFSFGLVLEKRIRFVVRIVDKWNCLLPTRGKFISTVKSHSSNCRTITIQYNKKIRYMRPLLWRPMTRVLRRAPHALPNSSVLSRLQNVRKSEIVRVQSCSQWNTVPNNRTAELRGWWSISYQSRSWSRQAAERRWWRPTENNMLNLLWFCYFCCFFLVTVVRQ